MVRIGRPFVELDVGRVRGRVSPSVAVDGGVHRASYALSSEAETPMDTEISVTVESSTADAYRLSVRVREGRSETAHEVTLGSALLARLAPGEAADAFVRRCFAFLLDREPKESILRSFDVSVIARYFPEFEAKIARKPSV
jgi:hypothetical protein